MIHINIVAEDPLSEVMMRTILQRSGRQFLVMACYGKKGAGYIKKQLIAFNMAAKVSPFFVLTDLDDEECAPMLLKNLLKFDRHPNLIFRIAIREVESWILADQENLSKFLGVGREKIPADVEGIPDPKQVIVNLANRSRSRIIRESIAPAHSSYAQVGPDYNGQLGFFIQKYWDIKSAMVRSKSLQKTISSIKNFRPQKQNQTEFSNEDRM